GLDSFGQIPIIEDQGMMSRGILAVGKQDINFDNLKPLDDKIKIIGGSSDHLLVNLIIDYQVGDILSFKINYPGLLQLMTSKYVKKKYL
ncbi:MAG: alanine/ornithine racemase family PLP-dependent enzyme, partial [Bacilli bacterium]|nr:alanine/ornithine racemase family PLP-dependent enzyme [Bacilli bacterium]